MARIVSSRFIAGLHCSRSRRLDTRRSAAPVRIVPEAQVLPRGMVERGSWRDSTALSGGGGTRGSRVAIGLSGHGVGMCLRPPVCGWYTPMAEPLQAHTLIELHRLTRRAEDRFGPRWAGPWRRRTCASASETTRPRVPSMDFGGPGFIDRLGRTGGVVLPWGGNAVLAAPWPHPETANATAA